MCAGDKGKKTNKQVEAARAEVQMQGAVQSCITCRVRYAMCENTWKSFGDALEMHRKSMEFDMQGRTLTPAYPQNLKALQQLLHVQTPGCPTLQECRDHGKTPE